MNLSLSLPAPIVLAIGDKQYSIGRFSMQDQIDFAATLDAARRDEATKGLNPQERFKTISFYVLAPTDFGEIEDMIKTPAGTDRVLRKCLSRDSVTWLNPNTNESGTGFDKALLEALLVNGDRAELRALARALAGIPDPPAVKPVNASPNATLATEGQGSDPTNSAPGSSA